MLGILDLVLKAIAVVFVAYIMVAWQDLPAPLLRELLPLWRWLGFRVAARNALRRLWARAVKARDYPTAIAYRRETVGLGLGSPDIELACDLAGLGLTLSESRSHPRGLQMAYMEQAERLSRGWRRLAWRNQMLLRLGIDLVAQGRFAEGLLFLREAVDAARETRDRKLLASALSCLIFGAVLTDEPAEARSLGGEALELTRAIGRAPSLAVLLVNLTAASRDAQDVEAAWRYLTEAEKLAAQLPPMLQANLLESRAQLELQHGNVTDARTRATEAAQLRQTVNRTSAFSKAIIARTYLNEGRMEDAAQWIAEAQSGASDMIDQRAVALALDDLAAIEAQADRQDDAKRHREEAIRLRTQPIPESPVEDPLVESVRRVLANRLAVKPVPIPFRLLYYSLYGVWGVVLLAMVLPIEPSAYLIAGKLAVLSAAAGVAIWGKYGLQAPVTPSRVQAAPLTS